MAEEQKEEAASQKKETDEKDTEEPTEEEDPQGEDSEQLDYEARLKAEEEKLSQKEKQLKQAEYNIEKEKEEKKELRDKLKEQNPSLTKEDVEEMLDRKLGRFTQNLQERQYDAELSNLASSESERRLMKFHLDNSIRLTGDPSEDVSRAKALANKGRTEAKLEEISRANSSKKSQGRGAGQKKPEKPSKPELSDTDNEFIKKRGFSWDADKGVFVSPSGKLGWHPDKGQVRL